MYADSGVQMELSLDDETGKILSLSCVGSVYEEIGSGTDAADSFGGYLGCHVASKSVSDSEVTGYLDEEMKKIYESEIQNQAESGSTWDDARAQVCLLYTSPLS